MRSERHEKRKKHRILPAIIIIIIVVIAAVVCMYKAGVLPREAKISLANTSIHLYKNDEKKLTVVYKPARANKPDIKWTSSDSSIASVSKNGTVTAVGKGSTSISAKTSSGQKVKCAVKVSDPAKTVYMTFDDGPSSNITPKILKLLRDNHVHATFFIVGYEAKINPDLVKQAYKDGNTIGIHTYTHNYTQIYASKAAFLSDFDKTQRLLTKITGKKPCVSRMPGGSANGYCSISLSKSIVKTLRARGYKVSDWSTSFGDTSLKDTSVKTMLHRAEKGIRGKKYPVILSHDSETKLTSYETAKAFIEYCKKKHYVFSTLDKYKGNPPLQIEWDPNK